MRQIWRTDRMGRGGDHIPFLDAGYPAIRFSVAVEDYEHQHQDLRVENGVTYGDTIDEMDFPYLAKVTRLNVRAAEALASAPMPPEVQIEAAVRTDTLLTWNPVPGATGYRVWVRRTDEANWELYAAVVGTGARASGPPRLSWTVPLRVGASEDVVLGSFDVEFEHMKVWQGVLLEHAGESGGFHGVLRELLSPRGWVRLILGDHVRAERRQAPAGVLPEWRVACGGGERNLKCHVAWALGAESLGQLGNRLDVDAAPASVVKEFGDRMLFGVARADVDVVSGGNVREECGDEEVFAVLRVGKPEVHD